MPRWRRRKRSKSGPAQQSALQPSVEQEQVRVSVGVNMFVAASTDASDEALKAQEAGRRLIYDLAAHECVLLRDVLASDWVSR